MNQGIKWVLMMKKKVKNPVQVYLKRDYLAKLDLLSGVGMGF
jgi:hypothetical protein